MKVKLKQAIADYSCTSSDTMCSAVHFQTAPGVTSTQLSCRLLYIAVPKSEIALFTPGQLNSTLAYYP